VCHRHHGSTSANLQSCDLRSGRRIVLVFCLSLHACVKMALSSADINSVWMVAGSWLDLRRYYIRRVAKSHLMTGDTLVVVCWHNAYIHWLFEMSLLFLSACTHCLTNTRIFTYGLCAPKRRQSCDVRLPVYSSYGRKLPRVLLDCRHTVRLSEASRAVSNMSVVL